MITLLAQILLSSLSFSAPVPPATVPARIPAASLNRIVKSAPQFGDLRNITKDLKSFKQTLDRESRMKNQPLGQRIVFPADIIPAAEVMEWLRASPELDQQVTQNPGMGVAFEKFFLKHKAFYVFEIESNQTDCSGSDYRFIADDFATGISMNLSGCN